MIGIPEIQARIRAILMCVASTLVFVSVSTMCSKPATAQFVGDYGQDQTLAGNPVFAPDTLNFGLVVLGDMKSLSSVITNKGTADLQISGITVSAGYSFTGHQPTYSLMADSSETYTVTFAPSAHNSPDGLHVGALTFFFSDGTQKHVALIGYDHIPIHDTLLFTRNYWGYAGSEVLVSQILTSSLANAVDSVHLFREQIQYDQNLLTLVKATNGAITPLPDWAITALPKSVGATGIVEITGASTGAALQGSGEIIKLYFHLNDTARVFDSSTLSTDTAAFGKGFEPIFASSPGLVRVRDTCTPLFVSIAAPASSIEQNSPNPVTSHTQITYYVRNTGATPAPVRLRIYNSLGEQVRSLVDREDPPGAYMIDLDTAPFPKGFYTYSFDCGSHHEVKRLIISR